MNFPPVMTLTLTGQNNETFIGTLYLGNRNSSQHDPPLPAPVMDEPPPHYYKDRNRKHDPSGATYYVIAVVLVYGMSIVLLIASHINRKHAKAQEDHQINKYLQEFQVSFSLCSNIYFSESCLNQIIQNLS